jgi:hypothetical protein
VGEVGYTGNDETFVSDDASKRDKAVPDYSSTLFDCIVNTLYNNEVCSGEEDKETK